MVYSLSWAPRTRSTRRAQRRSTSAIAVAQATPQSATRRTAERRHRWLVLKLADLAQHAVANFSVPAAA